tara:strand:+ start:108 stop:290 length:183 start_codon:yes stop_codon:yes gene_type:complete
VSPLTPKSSDGENATGQNSKRLLVNIGYGDINNSAQPNDLAEMAYALVIALCCPGISMEK